MVDRRFAVWFSVDPASYLLYLAVLLDFHIPKRKRKHPTSVFSQFIQVRKLHSFVFHKSTWSDEVVFPDNSLILCCLCNRDHLVHQWFCTKLFYCNVLALSETYFSIPEYLHGVERWPRINFMLSKIPLCMGRLSVGFHGNSPMRPGDSLIQNRQKATNDFSYRHKTCDML